MRIWLLGLVIALLTFNVQADSEQVRPPLVTTAKSVSLHVLHLAQNVTRESAIEATYPCPAGSKRLKSQFFEAKSNKPSDNLARGYYFFICEETDWADSSYYNSLKNSNWTPCQPAGNSQCSIKVSTPPYVRLIVKIPPVDREGNAKNGFLIFGDATLYINETTNIGSTDRTKDTGPLVYTWTYDSNFPPALAPSNYKTALIWSLQGAAWSEGGTKGTYKCGTSNYGSFGFPLILTSESFGRTYELSCRGYWDILNKTWSSTTPEVTAY